MTSSPRPRPFVLTSTDHGSMIVNRLDTHQLPTGAAYGVGFQLLTKGSYDKDEINFVLNVLRTRRKYYNGGVVALDCGANIGVHTLEMAQEMAGWGKVIAFEAQERLYYALCGNIALNNLFNASAVFTALGCETGTIKIPQPNYNKPASFGSLEIQKRPNREYIGQNIDYSDRNLVQIPLTALDSLNLPRVDFIKLDVEGMELDVLMGAKNLIAKFLPDMLIEWIKSGKDEICNFLHGFDYIISEAGANLFCEAANGDRS